MIRMTKVADYGMILMMQIASKDLRAIHTSRDLSASTGVPLPMASKILKTLVRGQVLESQRGTKGGYRLTRAAELISVGQLISALEGPIALTECISDTGPTCDIELLCPVKSNWQRINQAVRDALDGITLAEMAAPLRRPSFRVETLETAATIAND